MSKRASMPWSLRRPSDDLRRIDDPSTAGPHGQPAVGKSVTARALVEGRPRCAFIDADDVRQLVVTGAAAPWEGKKAGNSKGSA